MKKNTPPRILLRRPIVQQDKKKKLSKDFCRRRNDTVNAQLLL